MHSKNNFVKDDVTEVPETSLDFITMIFFLSAVHPDYFTHTIEKAKKLLKSGGCILFRDYGAYDCAMIRFLK